MPREKSAGAVVFYKEGGTPFYLLLHSPSGSKTKREHWDFPKGHVEPGETEEQTVRREIKEETNISDLEFMKGFRETIAYFFQAKGKKIFKTVVFYLTQTQTKNVTISFEHMAYTWLSFDDAMRQLKFGNAKKILTKANSYLLQKGIIE